MNNKTLVRFDRVLTRVTIVRAWEETPPTDAEQLEWVLYCSPSVNSLVSARAAIAQYACRWVVEEYHKALKSGLKAEELRMRSKESLFAAISIMAVIALGIVALRDRIRLIPDASATESGLTSLQLHLLESSTGMKLANVRQVALALGRLGGHLNRKRDGMPGILSLWRGMTYLLQLEHGAQLAMEFSSVKNCG